MDINIILSHIDSLLSKGRVDDAKGYLLKMIDNAKEIKRDDIYISLCNELAGFYRVSGNKDACYKTLDSVLSLLKNKQLTHDISYVTTLLNKATAYSAFDESEQSIEIYKHVEKIYHKTLPQDDLRVASLYNNMSFTLLKIGQAELGLDYLKKSMLILENLEDCKIELATCHTNIGQITTALGRLDEAQNHLTLALDIFNTSNIYDVHYDALLTAFGNLKFKQKQFKESAKYYEKAAKNIKSKFGKNYNYNIICNNCAQAWKKSGNIEKEFLWKKEVQHD